MDRSGQLFEGPIGKPILPLIGGTIEAYDSLPDDTWGAVELDGKKHPWGVWADLLFAESAKPIATYADQFYSGAVAAMQNKVGSGAVTYCGVYGEQTFVESLVERIAAQLKLPVTPLPDRVHVLKRGRYKILLNYQDRAVVAPAPQSAHFVVGTRKVDPASVAVWEE
jgi:beta-galactosidase